MSRKIPEILYKEEQELLLSQFNTRYPTQERNRTMIKLMLDTGLRLAEVINLKRNHIYLEGDVNRLKVKEGKGAKDRTLWIAKKSVEYLSSWRKRQKEEVAKRNERNNLNLVFSTLKGNKLHPRNVRQMMYNYSNKAAIKKVNPHMLRHTFATDFLRETKNIRMVQKALGHADISTTMIYTHIVDDELENAMKNLRK